MSLNTFDLSEEAVTSPEVRKTHRKPSNGPPDDEEPLKTPMNLFLEDIRKFPLLTATLEKKFAVLKDRAEPLFQEQAQLLEQAILTSLAGVDPSGGSITGALEKIKCLILRREVAMVSDHPYGREGAIPTPESDALADAAFRRMVRASRNKRTFHSTIIEAENLTDDVFTRNLFSVMQKHFALCQRIATSDIVAVAALATITRESFTLLRSALPDGHPCLVALAERDATFAAEVTADEECRTYIEPLISQGYLMGIDVMTPHDVLMRANLPLVVSLARRRVGKGLELSDLIEEGNFGLYRAVAGFKASKNVRFSTYATFWVKQSIDRGMLMKGHEIPLPIYVHTLVIKWRRATKRLLTTLGRPPSDEEVQMALKISVQQVTIVKSALTRLNAKCSQGGEEWEDPVVQVVDKREPPVTDGLLQVDESDLVTALLEKLDPREAMVIRLRFPQDGSESKTLKEIGEQLGLTRERVRQIEVGGLQNLKGAMQDDHTIDDEEWETLASSPLGSGPVRPRKFDLPVAHLRDEPAKDFVPQQRHDAGAASPPLAPKPSRSPDAKQHQDLTPEEKSAVEKNIKSLVEQYTLLAVVQRIRGKGEHTIGAVRIAIRRAMRGDGLSPKYVAAIAGIFGKDVVSDSEETEAPALHQERG
ncbi:MAG: sigma-70 family RNA polymerase sigma factor [Candidatus Peregrinibacteria bacterium]|nr:sigma-70 family RNA polymerase sigma factor [Candidatus Peregrinibacteria bacterium]